MALTLISAPATTPVSVAEAKTHLNITGSDDDTYIGDLVDAATGYLDGHDGALSRALITQTWDYTLTSFPQEDHIAIPLPPLQSVTSISYYDTNGDSQTFASSKYLVDTASEPGVIHLAYGESWPGTRSRHDAVTIRFVAGYGDASTDIPTPILQALKLHIAHMYENREPVMVGANVTQVPMSVEFLLANFRMGKF